MVWARIRWSCHSTHPSWHVQVEKERLAPNSSGNTQPSPKALSLSFHLLGFTAQELTLGHHSMPSKLLTLFLSKELSLGHVITLVPRDCNQKCHKNMFMFSPLHPVRWIDGKKEHRDLIQESRGPLMALSRWYLNYFSLEAKIKFLVTSWTRVPLEYTPQIFLSFQVTRSEADDKNSSPRPRAGSSWTQLCHVLLPSLAFSPWAWFHLHLC